MASFVEQNMPASLAASPTPISQLHPDILNPSSRVVRAEIRITWPYSILTKSVAFLLAEPDVRLRRNKGQFRLQLSGSSAKAVAASGIGAGDELLLSLDGVGWAEDKSPGRIPGTRIDWQLQFAEKLTLQAKLARSNETRLLIINHPEPVPEPELPANTAIDDTKSNHVSELAFATPAQLSNRVFAGDLAEYCSPAFVKRARISYGSLFDGAFDMFEEDGGVKGKGRKRNRFGRQSQWRYSSQSRSPEPPNLSDEDAEIVSGNKMGSSLPIQKPQMTDEGCQTMDLEVLSPVAAAHLEAPSEAGPLSIDQPAYQAAQQPGNQPDAVSGPEIPQKSTSLVMPTSTKYAALENNSLFGIFTPSDGTEYSMLTIADQVRFSISHDPQASYPSAAEAKVFKAPVSRADEAYTASILDQSAADENVVTQLDETRAKDSETGVGMYPAPPVSITPDQIPEVFQTYEDRPPGFFEEPYELEHQAGEGMIGNEQTHDSAEDKVGASDEEKVVYDQDAAELDQGDYDQREHDSLSDEDEASLSDEDGMDQSDEGSYDDGDTVGAEYELFGDFSDENGEEDEAEEDVATQAHSYPVQQQVMMSQWPLQPKAPVYIDLLSDSDSDEKETVEPAPAVTIVSLPPPASSLVPEIRKHSMSRPQEVGVLLSSPLDSSEAGHDTAANDFSPRGKEKAGVNLDSAMDEDALHSSTADAPSSLPLANTHSPLEDVTTVGIISKASDALQSLLQHDSKIPSLESEDSGEDDQDFVEDEDEDRVQEAKNPGYGPEKGDQGEDEFGFADGEQVDEDGEGLEEEEETEHDGSKSVGAEAGGVRVSGSECGNVSLEPLETEDVILFASSSDEDYESEAGSCARGERMISMGSAEQIGPDDESGNDWVVDEGNEGIEDGQQGVLINYGRAGIQENMFDTEVAGKTPEMTPGGQERDEPVKKWTAEELVGSCTLEKEERREAIEEDWKELDLMHDPVANGKLIWNTISDHDDDDSESSDTDASHGSASEIAVSINPWQRKPAAAVGHGFLPMTSKRSSISQVSEAAAKETEGPKPDISSNVGYRTDDALLPTPLGTQLLDKRKTLVALLDKQQVEAMIGQVAFQDEEKDIERGFTSLGATDVQETFAMETEDAVASDGQVKGSIAQQDINTISLPTDAMAIDSGLAENDEQDEEAMSILVSEISALDELQDQKMVDRDEVQSTEDLCMATPESGANDETELDMDQEALHLEGQKMVDEVDGSNPDIEATPSPSAQLLLETEWGHLSRGELGEGDVQIAETVDEEDQEDGSSYVQDEPPPEHALEVVAIVAKLPLPAPVEVAESADKDVRPLIDMRQESPDPARSSPLTPRPARATQSQKPVLVTEIPTARSSHRSTHARSRSRSARPESEADDDEEAWPPRTEKKAIRTKKSSPTPTTPDVSVLKAELARQLREHLIDYLPLRAVRAHLNNQPDILALVTRPPPEPVRAKGGPRDYMLSLRLTDSSLAQPGPGASVVEAQLFRPHKESLPLVAGQGDVVLLRRFKVVALPAKGFCLRTCEDSAWAVWELNNNLAVTEEGGGSTSLLGAPQMRGSPVEDWEQCVDYVRGLRVWWSSDEAMRGRVNKANAKLDDAGRANAATKNV